MKKLLLLLLLLASPAHAITVCNDDTCSSGSFDTDGDLAFLPIKGYHSSGAANTIYLNGTFASGVVTIEASPDFGTTWIPVTGSWASAAIVNVEFRWTKLRLKLSGATAMTYISWWVL